MPLEMARPRGHLRQPPLVPGFSCRHQIADFCDNRRGLHTAELLAMAGVNTVAKDVSMPIHIADLFRDEPIQWALRGDPWLWREMRERFAATPCPATPEELVGAIENMFEQLTGKPISHPDHIFVERYSHGGMSSGLVVPEFWRDTAIPLLTRRYKAR